MTQNLVDYIGNSDVVFMSHEQDAMLHFEYIHANKLYFKLITEVFGHSFFRLGINSLFRPLPHILATIDVLWRKYLVDKFVVGIQLRWGRGRNDIYFQDWEYDLNRFFECGIALAMAKRTKKEVVFFISTGFHSIR